MDANSKPVSNAAVWNLDIADELDRRAEETHCWVGTRRELPRWDGSHGGLRCGHGLRHGRRRRVQSGGLDQRSETTEDMEWDTAVLEAALHELDHLRHGHGAHGVSSSSLDRGLLDTNDGGLTHADGGVMSMAHDAVYVSVGPRTVTVVPDTNALILEGGASLDRLLERFRAATGADGHVTRARVAVPRKVVQELDGLKSHSGIGGAAGDRRAEVAALARSVNRALERRLRRQQLGQPGSNDDEAELLVQGPADAGRMRVRMRAEGLRDGTGGNGDEEIVYFCQREGPVG